MENEQDFWGEPISTYSRAHGIEDGVLVDVTGYAKQYFKWPVAVTQALWYVIDNEVVNGKRCADYEGILHDIFHRMILKIRSGGAGDRLTVKVWIGKRTYDIVSVVGPGIRLRR